MLNDCINIGPVPSEEQSAQVGTAQYLERSERECAVFKRMLDRLYPVPEGVAASIAVSSFPHDFGPYREVCVKFDGTCAKAMDYAYGIDANAPTTWDAIAKYELAWRERRDAFRRAFGAGDLQADNFPSQYALDRLPALEPGVTFATLLERHPL
jgi:hypothetical protein